MKPIKFIVLSLATLRLTWLFVHEEGPYNIFGKLRYWSGIRKYDEVEPDEVEKYIEAMGLEDFVPEILHKNELLANILSCVYCCSIWIGFFIAILSKIKKLDAIWYGLSFSAITVLLRDKF